MVDDPPPDDAPSSLSDEPSGEGDSVLRLLAARQPADGDASADPGMPHPGEVIDAKYKVLRLVGRGGMGWVFEALHLQTEKTVALKYLRHDLACSTSWLERFAREARTAGRIDHPNVIRIYDVGGAGAGTYIVMEYLRGKTLRDCLRQGPMPHVDALPMLLAVMRGVIEAHRLGIVHRDLKPDNIFLCMLPNGQPDMPKVLDFGVSKLLDHSEELRADRTPLGYAGGTPLYMPLEQLQAGPVDARADVYALGVVLFEMLTGTYPFPARTREDLVVALSTRPPERLPASVHPRSEQLDAIIGRALARERIDRYPSVSAFAADLELIDGGASASSSERSQLPKLRAASLWLLGAVALSWALWIGLRPTQGTAHSRSSVAHPAAKMADDIRPAAGVLERHDQSAGTSPTIAPSPANAANQTGATVLTPQTSARRTARRTADQDLIVKARAEHRALDLRPEDF